MTKAPIVVLEGIDGSGKTSMAPVVTDELMHMGWGNVVVTREPWNNSIRGLMKAHPDDEEFVAALAYADRVRHVQWMQKMSEDGVAVVCDRFWPSTFAYQKNSGLMPLNKQFAGVPSLYILLKVSPSVAWKRISDRGGPDEFESIERLEQASKNYDNVFDYLERFKKSKTFVVSSDQELDGLEASVREVVRCNVPRHEKVWGILDYF